MPRGIRQDDLLLRLVKDVNDIRAALRHITSNLPLYDIANENSVTLSTDQDDYAVGNYDVLRVNATTDIEITGLRGGVKGRFLEFVSVGTGFIKFKNQNASSSPENRFKTPYDDDISIIQNSRVRFYYDSTFARWMLSDEPQTKGLYGKTAILTSSTLTIPTSAWTKIEYDTVQSDEWGYWSVANKRFQIPNGESGLYYIGHEGVWERPAASLYGASAIYFGDSMSGSSNVAAQIVKIPTVGDSVVSPYHTLTWIRRLGDNPGAYLYPALYQASGGDLDWTSPSVYFSKIL